MHILGIETATKTGSVAIATEGRIVAEYTLNIELTHSERLMATVDRVLKDTGMTMADIDGFGVSIGPGSFTGLRIGVATVKGLSFTSGKPAAAVPTLYALAWNIPYALQPICPLLDAKKKEVYAALYRYEGKALVQEMRETAIALPDLAALLGGEVIFTGEGARLHQTEILRLFGDRAHFAPLSAAVSSAASVAEVAQRMLLEGRPADLDTLAPLYVRRPEAEVAWEKRRQSR
jgi:tRNA threonylcarbamoyladenosine biosynthesis protein TsaB